MYDKVGEIGTLSEEIIGEYMIWRIWIEKGTPLDELKNKWTYPDLLKANDLLNMQSDYSNAITAYYDSLKDKK